VADIYVTSAGNDSTGDGSSGSPYLTISKAFTEAANSDVIIVNDSATYTVATGGANQVISAGGALKSSLTFKAGTGCTPIFDGDDSAVYCFKTWSGWTIQGLTFRNFAATGGDTTSIIHGYSGMSIVGHVSDCVFYDSDGGAIYFQGAGSSVLRNKIYNIGKRGIDCGIGDITTIVRNNLIYDCGTNAILGTSITVDHNTVYNTPKLGTNGTTYAVRGGIVRYNIVSGSNCTIAALQGSSRTYNCVTGAYDASGGNNPVSIYGGAGTGGVDGSPIFTDEANDDYTLGPGSPGRGSSVGSSLTVDLLSKSRQWSYDHKVLGRNTANDEEMGCYEHEGKILGVATQNIAKVMGQSG